MLLFFCYQHLAPMEPWHIYQIQSVEAPEIFIKFNSHKPPDILSNLALVEPQHICHVIP